MSSVTEYQTTEEVRSLGL